MTTSIMQCTVDGFPELGFNFTLRPDLNPDTVAHILDVQKKYGLSCYLGHVVISGKTFWLPSRTSYTGTENKVTRAPGDVYLYSPGESICFNYGPTTESAKVNKFGEVSADSLPVLQALGELVWKRTILDFVKTQILMTIAPAN